MRKIRKQKTNNIYQILLFTLIFIFFIFGEETQNKENNYKAESEIKETFNNVNDNNDKLENNINIHYIDVGQGDSIFIELPNNNTMLIDAGESSQKEIVKNYITNLGYSKIDYLIGTHPHTDHIGGLAYIINNFIIDKIYMPNALSTSKTYENLLNTIASKNLKVKTAKAGVKILDEEDLKINIIAPNSKSYEDLNNYSAVIKIVYKNRSFLFMGDAEIESENEIKVDVSADVIKIGHHGSNSSTGKNFINKVKAKYAIISVGSDNKYSHPYQTVIDRLTNNKIEIYRTDLNGNILVKSDGYSLDISSSK